MSTEEIKIVCETCDIQITWKKPTHSGTGVEKKKEECEYSKGGVETDPTPPPYVESITAFTELNFE